MCRPTLMSPLCKLAPYKVYISDVHSNTKHTCAGTMVHRRPSATLKCANIQVQYSSQQPENSGRGKHSCPLVATHRKDAVIIFQYKPKGWITSSKRAQATQKKKMSSCVWKAYYLPGECDCVPPCCVKIYRVISDKLLGKIFKLLACLSNSHSLPFSVNTQMIQLVLYHTTVPNQPTNQPT